MGLVNIGCVMTNTTTTAFSISASCQPKETTHWNPAGFWNTWPLPASGSKWFTTDCLSVTPTQVVHTQPRICVLLTREWRRGMSLFVLLTSVAVSTELRYCTELSKCIQLEKNPPVQKPTWALYKLLFFAKYLAHIILFSTTLPSAAYVRCLVITVLVIIVVFL